jgi:hypothetical protein
MWYRTAIAEQVAESTESTESFQPHFMGKQQIRRKTVTEITLLPEPNRSKLSVFSAHSAAPLHKPPQAARVQPALSETQGPGVRCQAGAERDQRVGVVRPRAAASRRCRDRTSGWGFSPEKPLFGFLPHRCSYADCTTLSL